MSRRIKATRLRQGKLQPADEAATRVEPECYYQAASDNNAVKVISYCAKSPNVALTYNELGFPRGYDKVAIGYRKELASLAKSNGVTTSDCLYQIVSKKAFVTCIEALTTSAGKAAKPITAIGK